MNDIQKGFADVCGECPKLPVCDIEGLWVGQGVSAFDRHRQAVQIVPASVWIGGDLRWHRDEPEL